MQGVQVMMLAAGLGTRLWPLTADRGKPAVPFMGRPLIRGLLDWLHGQGAERVVVNTHHRPSSIREALAHPPPGMEVYFSHEDPVLGTAGALGRAREAGLLVPDRSTLVVNAKLVTDIDLSAAVAEHRRSQAAATWILRPNQKREAFTTVHVEDGWVRRLGPSRVAEGTDPLLFTGLHILEPEVLAATRAEFSDTVKSIYPPFIEAGRVRAHVDGARWEEFSTLARYLDLQLADLSGPRVVLAPTAFVEAGAELSDSVVWAESRVAAGARLTGCVVAEGVSVPPGVDLAHAVLFRPELAATAPPGAPSARVEHGFAWVPIARPPA